MILGFTIVLVSVSVLAGLLCLSLGLAGRKPMDVTLGALVVVELLLLVQIVMAIVALTLGNLPTGSLLEFWIYLASAAIIPPLAVLWALVERTRWSTAVLGVGALAVAVMSYRMYQIWFIQLA